VDIVDGVLDLLPDLFHVVAPVRVDEPLDLLRELCQLMMLVAIADGVLGLLRDFVSRLLDLDSEECAEFTDDCRLFELAAELRRLDSLSRFEVFPRLEDLL